MKPIRRNLREQLVDGIGSDIVSGQLQPGDLLPNEEQLLSRYGVSRTVLREALNVLAGKGLLEARPKRGTVVRPTAEWSQLDPVLLALRAEEHTGPPAEDLSQTLDRLMEVRRITEPAAAGLAARRATEEDFARISAAYDDMVAAQHEPEAFMKADLDFHVACLCSSHNDFLLPVTHAIRSVLMRSLRITNRDPELNRSVSLPLHRAILDAILARNPEAAFAAMERHLNDTESRWAKARQRLKSGPLGTPEKLKRNAGTQRAAQP